IGEVDGFAHQLVQEPRAELTVSTVAGSELSAALAGPAGRGFDLATEAPLRAALFVLAKDEHVLMLVLHHIAADGWSMAPLLRDLAAAYEARSAGRAPGWAPQPVGYADYALWQRAALGSLDEPDSRASAQLRYWTT